jgi:hypothetical protein
MTWHFTTKSSGIWKFSYKRVGERLRNGEALIRIEVDQGFGSNYGWLPPSEPKRV